MPRTEQTLWGEMAAYAWQLSDWAMEVGPADIYLTGKLMREANEIRGAVLDAKWSGSPPYVEPVPK